VTIHRSELNCITNIRQVNTCNCIYLVHHKVNSISVQLNKIIMYLLHPVEILLHSTVQNAFLPRSYIFVWTLYSYSWRSWKWYRMMKRRQTQVC